MLVDDRYLLMVGLIHKAIYFSVKICMQRIGIYFNSTGAWPGVQQEMGKTGFLPCSGAGVYWTEAGHEISLKNCIAIVAMQNYIANRIFA